MSDNSEDPFGPDYWRQADSVFGEEAPKKAARRAGHGRTLRIEGFGRITVKDGMDGGKLIVIETQVPVKAKIIQDVATEVRVVVGLSASRPPLIVGWHTSRAAVPST